MVFFKKLHQKWAEDRKKRCLEAEKRIQRLHDRGRAVFKKFHIQKAVLFGSVTDERCQPHSDIDLFVQPLPNELYWSFRRELEEAVSFPVDLYTSADDVSLVNKIISRGEIIYENEI